jgi:hypothetical protein
MPVSKISVFVESRWNCGDGAWMGRRCCTFTGPRKSTGSPSRLNTRPRHSSPTGTVIGPPVLRTGVPRTTPSVDDMATARTWSRPMCCWTSATSVVFSSPSPCSMVSAV